MTSQSYSENTNIRIPYALYKRWLKIKNSGSWMSSSEFSRDGIRRLLEDIEKEFIAQVLKMIFRK